MVNSPAAASVPSPLKNENTDLLKESVYENNSSANSLFAGSYIYSLRAYVHIGKSIQVTKVSTSLTSGNSEGPSKLMSIYLIKSRLSTLISLLCSNDGTCIQIQYQQNYS